MRLILRLKALNNCSQTKENNSKFLKAMHGFIYNSIENNELYESNEFKPFVFSNIYPIKNQKIEEKQEYSLIISSFKKEIILLIIKKLIENTTLNLGEYSFIVSSFKPVPSELINDFCLLTTETIALAYNKNNKAITLNESKTEFLELLKNNLIKKFNQFNNEKISKDFDLWDNIELSEITNSKKAIKLEFTKNQKNHFFTAIGSRYQINIGKINETQQKILQTAYETGIGEKNSYGFGFINLKNKREEKK